jgi:hypothetical protein
VQDKFNIILRATTCNMELRCDWRLVRMKETAVLKIAYISRVLKKLTNIHLHCRLRGSLCNKFGTSCLKPVYSFVFVLCRTKGQAPSLDRFFVALILYLNKIFYLTYLLRSYNTHSYNTILCHSTATSHFPQVTYMYLPISIKFAKTEDFIFWG